MKGKNEEKSAADMVSEAENVVTARQLPGLIPASFTALVCGNWLTIYCHHVTIQTPCRGQ